MKHPAWLDEAIFYEVYPQSFKDTNADGIGDIPGIIEKLDYIHDLGCNAIWINPCFASPFGDAGYDVADCYPASAQSLAEYWRNRLYLCREERLSTGISPHI